MSEAEKSTALLFVQSKPELFRADFETWLNENFHIWQTFHKFASQMACRRKHYSARTIIEKIRFDTDVAQTNGDLFKINGNYVPDLARLWSLYHPAHKDFFEFRVKRDAYRRKA